MLKNSKLIKIHSQENAHSRDRTFFGLIFSYLFFYVWVKLKKDWKDAKNKCLNQKPNLRQPKT